jgi:hypothetical protein
MKKLIPFFFLSFLFISLLSAEVISIKLPKKEAVKLTPYATFDFADINVSSAMV